MNTIGFIGAYDKIDLVVYVARILTAMNKKVLIIDATTLQKSKYIIPTMAPTKTYVTTFEDMDFAIGFYDYESIKEYLGMPSSAVFTYDYIFIDVDSPEALESFDIKTANKNYFVTAFDTYSIKRGLEILSGIEEAIPLTKVFFSREITKEEDEYFNYVSLGAKVIWNEEKIYFPFEQGDQSVIMENQRVEKIKLKKLTKLYKESLAYLTEDILNDEKESSNLTKAMKLLEKGV